MLREEAMDLLRDSGKLGDYQGKLAEWAATYRDRNWPETTPDYLLRGYWREPVDRGYRAGLAALAGDAGRHERMRKRTGDNKLGLAEFEKAQKSLVSIDSIYYDYKALVIIAVERDRIKLADAEDAARSKSARPSLFASLDPSAELRYLQSHRSWTMQQMAVALAVYAREAELAERFARHMITDSGRLARTLADLAVAAEEDTDANRAARLRADAEHITGSTYAYSPAQALQPELYGPGERLRVESDVEGQPLANQLTGDTWAQAFPRLALNYPDQAIAAAKEMLGIDSHDPRPPRRSPAAG
jgi:hypothetical protein